MSTTKTDLSLSLGAPIAEDVVRRDARRTRLRPDALPRDAVAMALVLASFVAFAVGIAGSIGAAFVIPRGTSPVMGTEATAPFVVTLVVYAGVHVSRALRTGARAFEPSALRRIATDLVLLGMFAVVLYVHFHLKMWVPLVNDRSFDASFFAIDEALRPVVEGMRVARRATASLLPRADVWYDLAFFSMFSLAFWSHSLGPRRWLFHNMFGITIVEVLGPLLYLAAPACGPFLFEAGDNARATLAQQEMYGRYSALQEGGLVWMDANGPAYFTAPVAAMPSLHLAATFVLAYYAVRARLWIAPFAVLGVTWIALEAVASRWHYLVDLPAGLFVAVVAIAGTNRLCAFRMSDA